MFIATIVFQISLNVHIKGFQVTIKILSLRKSAINVNIKLLISLT